MFGKCAFIKEDKLQDAFYVYKKLYDYGTYCRKKARLFIGDA